MGKKTDNTAIDQQPLPPTRYYGRVKHLRSLEHFHLSISKHAKEDYIPKHYHFNPYISLNLGANYLENDGFSKKVVKSGNIIVRPSFYEHQNEFRHENGICFNIEINPKAPSEIHRSIQKGEFNLSNYQLFELLAKSTSNFLDNELDCFIAELLLGKVANQNANRIPAWYFRVLSKVKDDYHTEISLSNIAKSVGLHPNYLARKFKTIHGATLGEFIRQTRLENACLKMFSNTKLTQVALASGFYDQSHFSKAFRTSFSMMPKEFRRHSIG